MKLRPIGELTEKIATWNPARAQSVDNFTYIDLSSIDSLTKEIVKPQQVTPESAPSRARQLVRAGDIIVSTVRPNLNGVAVVPSECDGATASTGFTVLRPTTEVESAYLFHWVRSPLFISAMIRQATGQSYPAVSDRIIKNSLIPLPSRTEQLHIARLLDHMDALRAKRREAIALLDGLAQSIFLDMFGNPRQNPMGWPTDNLANLADPTDRINYGVIQPGDHRSDGIPLVRVGDLLHGRVDRSAMKKIDPQIEAKYSRSRLRGNEVLVGCVGSIGAVALVNDSDIGSNIARAVARIPISSEPLRQYIAEHLRAASIQHYFVNELRSVAQPTLNIKQLAETVVMMPPPGLPEEFASRAALVRRQQKSHTAHLSLLDSLFVTLQHRAFRGEVVPNVAASVA
ncbi:restriction endonuclease subunit S [Streptomyces zagrosensis]|uniref:Type I restriction enzyme S subunit n=1 Tax=Streptomyces zagrosensis TaxID=1042984 RepID=A0A7W9UZK9_9ACTN|nr:restriction endonuclease subunit S [Streptomyces zagrosensis]MBB5935879.1 type I restriction enzyme S subunit [Streptomyces zagrosensis]